MEVEWRPDNPEEVWRCRGGLCSGTSIFPPPWILTLIAPDLHPCHMPAQVSSLRQGNPIQQPPKMVKQHKVLHDCLSQHLSRA